jgi:hypothetical protein
MADPASERSMDNPTSGGGAEAVVRPGALVTSNGQTARRQRVGRPTLRWHDPPPAPHSRREDRDTHDEQEWYLAVSDGLFDDHPGAWLETPGVDTWVTNTVAIRLLIRLGVANVAGLRVASPDDVRAVINGVDGLTELQRCAARHAIAAALAQAEDDATAPQAPSRRSARHSGPRLSAWTIKWLGDRHGHKGLESREANGARPVGARLSLSPGARSAPGGDLSPPPGAARSALGGDSCSGDDEDDADSAVLDDDNWELFSP